MLKKINHHPCDLCGQPVKINGFSASNDQSLKQFCCAGCLSIFQLLNHDPKNHNYKPENIA